MIYLDNAATSPVYPEALEAMKNVCTADYFNPSSTYSAGLRVRARIAEARGTVASALGCAPDEVYFTSCATEANNWALTCGAKNKKGNIVVSAGEHACVYECAKFLLSSGLDVRFCKLNSRGEADEADLLSKVDESTCLVSVMHASNETGVINDIAHLSRAVKRKAPRALFHSDGVQAFLKTDNDVGRLGVDLYAVSGHKVGAPKGIGALYISSRVKIRPFIHGGGQERGLRSGTENVAGIVAFAAAIERYKHDFTHEDAMKKRDLAVKLLGGLEGVKVICEQSDVTGMIVAFTAAGTKAEIIQSMCSDDGVLIGRGSACSSRLAGNRVLREIGLSSGEIEGALRLSFSPETSAEEIEEAVRVIGRNIEKLRGGRVG